MRPGDTSHVQTANTPARNVHRLVPASPMFERTLFCVVLLIRCPEIHGLEMDLAKPEGDGRKVNAGNSRGKVERVAHWSVGAWQVYGSRPFVPPFRVLHDYRKGVIRSEGVAAL